MNKEILIDNIKAANKAIPCDLVVKNISVVDVFQCNSFICDVAIKNGYIVGHIESSMLTPREYSKTALLHGVTSLIADPHEIANVIGQAGIEFMINSSKNLPFDFYFMLPSCVPSTPFENSGAVLNSEDLKNYYSDSKVLGLAEVMDYPSV